MKKILIFCLSIALFSSCKKEIKELPAATQTGANTFGAKINGVFWAPQGFGPFPANDILDVVKAGTEITIRARNFSSSPIETEFQLTIFNVTAPGTYHFNTDVVHPNGAASYGYYVKRNFTPINEWITSSAFTGQITITKLDEVNKILSGTFEFNAGSIHNTEVIQVTEGRFDLKL